MKTVFGYYPSNSPEGVEYVVCKNIVNDQDEIQESYDYGAWTEEYEAMQFAKAKNRYLREGR